MFSSSAVCGIIIQYRTVKSSRLIVRKTFRVISIDSPRPYKNLVRNTQTLKSVLPFAGEEDRGGKTVFRQKKKNDASSDDIFMATFLLDRGCENVARAFHRFPVLRRRVNDKKK